LNTTADFLTFREPTNVVEEPNKSDSEKNSLFRGTPIKIKTNKPELSTSFYVERNPLEQATPSPYQTFGFPEYKSPVTFDVAPIPVPSIPAMATTLVTQTQVKKPKEYSPRHLPATERKSGAFYKIAWDTWT
jgi:hypothetical protein